MKKGNTSLLTFFIFIEILISQEFSSKPCKNSSNRTNYSIQSISIFSIQAALPLYLIELQRIKFEGKFTIINRVWLQLTDIIIPSESYLEPHWHSTHPSPRISPKSLTIESNRLVCGFLMIEHHSTALINGWLAKDPYTYTR